MQRWRRVTRPSVAALALAAAALAVSGCSPGLDYPSIFPTAHGLPPPQAQATMDADQVQQATEALITERNRLSAQAQSAAQDKVQDKAQDKTQNKTGTAGAANAAKKSPVAAQTAPAAAATATQTAGAESKP